jgi:hypothetical protein
VPGIKVCLWFFYEIYFMKFVFVSAFLVIYFLLANRLKSSKSSALLASPKRHCLYRLDLLKMVPMDRAYSLTEYLYTTLDLNKIVITLFNVCQVLKVLQEPTFNPYRTSSLFLWKTARLVMKPNVSRFPLSAL